MREIIKKIKDYFDLSKKKSRWIELDGDDIYNLPQEVYHFIVPVRDSGHKWWTIITGYVNDYGRLEVQCDDNADCGWEPTDVTHYMEVSPLPDIDAMFKEFENGRKI